MIHLIKRIIPQSITRQMQVEEAEHVEVFPERELTPWETKKVNQLRLNAIRQGRNLYEKLNPAIHGTDTN